MQNKYIPYTGNLSDFGYRELEIYRGLLDAWLKHGLPRTFDKKGIKVAFNDATGYVFLINDDYQVAMLNDEKLEVFHTTPYGRHEGFLSDLVNEISPDDTHPANIEYILNAAENEGFDLPSPWLCLKIDRILEHADAVEKIHD